MSDNHPAQPGTTSSDEPRPAATRRDGVAVLVTGAGGLIGAALVRRLYAAGFAVHAHVGPPGFEGRPLPRGVPVSGATSSTSARWSPTPGSTPSSISPGRPASPRPSPTRRRTCATMSRARQRSWPGGCRAPAPAPGPCLQRRGLRPARTQPGGRVGRERPPVAVRRGQGRRRVPGADRSVRTRRSCGRSRSMDAAPPLAPWSDPSCGRRSRRPRSRWPTLAPVRDYVHVDDLVRAVEARPRTPAGGGVQRRQRRRYVGAPSSLDLVRGRSASRSPWSRRAPTGRSTCSSWSRTSAGRPSELGWAPTVDLRSGLERGRSARDAGPDSGPTLPPRPAAAGGRPRRPTPRAAAGRPGRPPGSAPASDRPGRPAPPPRATSKRSSQGVTAAGGGRVGSTRQSRPASTTRRSRTIPSGSGTLTMVSAARRRRSPPAPARPTHRPPGHRPAGGCSAATRRGLRPARPAPSRASQQHLARARRRAAHGRRTARSTSAATLPAR